MEPISDFALKTSIEHICIYYILYINWHSHHVQLSEYIEGQKIIFGRTFQGNHGTSKLGTHSNSSRHHHSHVTLPETNSSPLKIGHPKNEKNRIPTIHFFQVPTTNCWFQGKLVTSFISPKGRTLTFVSFALHQTLHCFLIGFLEQEAGSRMDTEEVSRDSYDLPQPLVNWWCGARWFGFVGSLRTL